MKSSSTHCTVALLLAVFAAPALAQAPAGSPQLALDAAAASSSAHTFLIFVRGTQAGSEEVTVLGLADGWALRGSGGIGPPLNLTTEYREARYHRDWKPLELTVNQHDNVNRWTVHTTVNGTAAMTDVTRNGQEEHRNHTVTADTLMLPNLIFGSYEALAARLAASEPDAQISVFVVPQNPVSATVTGVAPETIQLPGSTIDAKHWTLSFGSPAGALTMDVWTDGPRLLRLDIPSQMVTVIRNDISTVGARIMTLARPNDEQVTIPGYGFSLAATISKPADRDGAEPGPAKPASKMPAVVLVSNTSGTDRDEVIAGIPIFAQIATFLANEGFLVVRYDKRGTGQSGGRPESATYEDFAQDARAIMAYLAKRKDVDPKRIALAGLGEGGWSAMVAAARDKRVAALVLINTPSTTGTDLVLEQQQRMLQASGATAEAQAKAVEQQKAILQAVETGKGWEALAPDIRRRADTDLYRSFLTFDPTRMIARTRQPLLVVQAELDKEVLPHHGTELAQLGRAREKAQPTESIALPGLNHLLARATTGEVAEYGSLTERAVSSAALLEISSWLKKTLASPPAQR